MTLFTSTVSSRGQVTIPKRLRAQLELAVGDSVAFVAFNRGLVLLRLDDVLAKAAEELSSSDGYRDLSSQEIARLVELLARGLVIPGDPIQDRAAETHSIHP